MSETPWLSHNNQPNKYNLGKLYDNRYFILWAFYSSMYVNEKEEHYSFSFDSVIYAVGGNLGLFLGNAKNGCNLVKITKKVLIFIFL